VPSAGVRATADKRYSLDALLEPEIRILIDGKCHCGNIAFELEWEGEPP